MPMLIDVRTPEEFATSHIKGAVNMPVSDIMEGNLSVLSGVPRDTALQLYCHSGTRASYALSLLQSAGFSNVENLGGM